MNLVGRHYVTHLHHGVRRFAVVKSNRDGRGLFFTRVSRHWTWRGAKKAAHRLNIREGFTA